MLRFRLPAVAFVTAFVVPFASPITPRASAQDVLLDIKSPVQKAQAAMGIAIGDWDGDGIGDLAIGAPGDDTIAIGAGAVRIHSGKDGSILATFYGANFDDQFGSPLARMPDLDGDGIDDLAVAAINTGFSGKSSGSVYLYAGRTGALLRRIDGPAATLFFGQPLGSLGDVDGDGTADLYVGNDYGRDDLVHVYSGADGHRIITINGTTGELFGAAANAIDDLDGDGVRELLVGATLHVNSNKFRVGAAYVVSPVTGAILRTQEGAFGGEQFGADVAALADLDGDGVHDYAVAAAYDDQAYAAMVLVYSGATGAQLAKITTPIPGLELLAPGMIDAGDLNGDGIGDIAVYGTWSDSTLYEREPAALLFSGKNFLELDRIDTHDNVGMFLSRFGDLNGDGRDDLLVGLLDSELDGEVVVYAGDDLWLNITPGEAAAGATVQFNTREGPPGTLTLLSLEAIDGAPTFQVVGGVKQFGALGGNKFYGTVPSGLAGHDFTLRAYANDANGKVIASAARTLHCE